MGDVTKTGNGKGKWEIGNEVTDRVRVSSRGKLRYDLIFRFLVLVSRRFFLRVSNLAASKR